MSLKRTAGSAILLLTGVLSACRSTPEPRPSSKQPNIVVILADDLGYSDIGPYGSEIATPNLDRLAQNGIRYTQFYNAGRCCPSRASILTGQYSHKAGVGHMDDDKGHTAYRGFLSEESVTLAEALRGAGYQTSMSGKWHVGRAEDRWPRTRGFDRYYGTPTGGGVYFKKNLITRNNVFFVEDDHQVDLDDSWYATEAFTDHAIKFVEDATAKNRPFFLYLAHIAPHFPLQARTRDIDKYRQTYARGWDSFREKRKQRMLELGLLGPDWALSPRDENVPAWDDQSEELRADLQLRMAVFAAMVDSLDQNIGRFVAALQRLGQLDNTLLLFLSDNGGSPEGGPTGFSMGIEGLRPDEPGSYTSYGTGWAQVSSTPFRRYKAYMHEGGISTPLIVHWPRGIDPQKWGGSVRTQPAHIIDILPTLLDVAGASYPQTRKGQPTLPLRGQSLRPSFTHTETRSRTLYWEHEGNRAVRQGDWKLVALRDSPWELYHLPDDRTEQHDRIAEEPERAAQMQKLWETWAEDAGVLPYPIE